MLGDHLYASDNEISCARQILDVYDRVEHSVVGLKVTHADEIHNFGCATGTWQESDTILSITEFSEKPAVEYARQRLRVEGLDADNFLTVFGMYVLVTGDL